MREALGFIMYASSIALAVWIIIFHRELARMLGL